MADGKWHHDSLTVPLRRSRYPTNYIALFAFTFAEAVVVSIICLFYDATSVGIAAAMTALVTAGLSAYACSTKSDFTGMGAYLYAALLSLIVFGFVGSFFSSFYHTPWIQVRFRCFACTILLPCTRILCSVITARYAFLGCHRIRTCTPGPDV